MTWIAIGLFLGLALLGMPLAFSIGVGALAGIWLLDFDWVVLPQRMMHAVNSFPLMAIPLFMLAGELMVRAGIMDRLISFANSMVGRVHGGLAHVTITSGTIFASVSGAAVASASAMGSTLVPSMRKYYPDAYSSAVITAAANLGPVIPPSNAMIVYALMAGSSVSVGGLFLSGIVPGILLAISFMGIASWISWRRGYPLTGKKFNLRNVLQQARQAIVIILMPVIVVGGIVGGVFTATEGAAIAVVYSAFIGFFVTRQLKIADLPACFFKAAVTSSMVGALIAFASVMTFIFTIEMVPVMLSQFIQSLTADPMTFILLTMALLIVVGMLIESNAAYIMLVPLFAPVALTYGIDPLYFGFLFMYNLVVGMMTPPVGVLYFVMCGITKVPMAQLVKESLPFVACQFLLLALCIVFPSIVTGLPRLMGY
ncbi:TRAP transporter large permease [Amphritea sp. 2_MG-2023]|jgi:tripartite ATP-independent transporter DctM subunit|uniref:TRAP transporter large permease n=1 Tax=Amphritea TaxID=515417 RepID=UPI001C07180F|nr:MULTISPECIES: TRAP transporter large permease [Amphritea]MBU2964098.1 TRAP transporter large permease [Amphritea atlantica]MDO6418496.1 TRAP transporter large permease [Amphritea sp. 2_MG-2023]MDX2424421.1 TRAP transporter large permease [Amphritea sp.]